jgi:hypothetical protein
MAVTRRRALKLLFALLVLGAVLRLSGLVEIPARWLLAGLAVELLLAWIEAAILLTAASRVYRVKRRTWEPFEALLETLREIEPAPLFYRAEELSVVPLYGLASQGLSSGEMLVTDSPERIDTE